MRIRVEQMNAWDDSSRTRLNDWIIQVAAALNGGIEITSGTDNENMMCSIVNVVTPAPSGTEFSVGHGLGRAPVGAWWLRSYSVAAPGMIYFSESTSSTTVSAYLKCGAEAITGTLIIV